jgi:hypothetical protein
LTLLGAIGLPDTLLLYYSLPAMSYIALYSILPHKVQKIRDVTNNWKCLHYFSVCFRFSSFVPSCVPFEKAHLQLLGDSVC